MEKDEYAKAWQEDDQVEPIQNAVEAAAEKATQDVDDEFIKAFAETDARDEEDRAEAERREAARRDASKKADE